jgi:hypothetical protein
MARLVFLHNERPGQPGRSAFFRSTATDLTAWVSSLVATFQFILHERALLLNNFDSKPGLRTIREAAE